MSHELTQTNGRIEFAYAKGSALPWHGLGQEVPENATIEEWRQQAGMDWAIHRAEVQYATCHEPQPWEVRRVPESHVLFRSDTKAALGLVSSKYQVVQPAEVLEFFRDLVQVGGLELSAAGTIYGGKRFWATAKIGEASPAALRDKIGGYLLLSTSADGSLATEVRRTTIRVVCRNTLAMASKDATSVKVSHRSAWRPEQIKAFMQLNNAAFDAFVQRLTVLANKELRRDQAEHLLEVAFEGDPQKTRASAGFNKVMALFAGAGMGAREDGVYGTAWGLLNAVTEYADHHAAARSAENRMAAAQWGPRAALKDRMLALVEAI